MITNSIGKKRLLKREDIDPYQYTVSLLKEGFRTGLADKGMIQSFETQVMLILRDIIMRYTKGESSSVTTETAEKLLVSIYYSIDACTKSISDPEEAIDLIKKKSIKEIYDDGIEIVTDCVKEAKKLYEEVAQNKLDVSNESYNSTIDEAIPDFFKKYGVVFNAQGTMADMDYPLAFDDMNVKGIFYIKNYLETLKLETCFCKLFTDEDINNILADYKTSLINIFELLINNSIFSVLSEGDPKSLIVSEHQFEFILRKLNTAQIKLIVNEAFKKMITGLDICDQELIDYIHRYEKVFFMHRFINAEENGSLRSLAIINKDKHMENGIAFDPGKKMKNEAFRSVLSKIMGCTSAEDKVRIIRSAINSMDDFIDILRADCLFGDEFESLFRTLSDMELAALSRVVLIDELGDGPLSLSQEVIRKAECRKDLEEWQLQFIKFIKKRI
jgi:hypothetical protein